MLKKINLIILGIIMLISLSGCRAYKSPSDLIKRPKSLESTNDIKNIISNFLSEQDALTLAVSQKNKASIRKIDIDGDKIDEILLLYKRVENVYKGEGECGVIILKKKNDRWNEINRIEGWGDSIDLVEYKDITGDKLPEIFIGYNNRGSSNNSLRVYSYGSGYFDTIYNTQYRNFALDDLNDDGKTELIILNRLEDNSTNIEVLNYFNEKINYTDNLLIDNKSYYSTMNVGNVSKYKKGIFVDFDMGVYDSYTNLYVMENNKLVEALRGKDKASRRDMIKSQDINSDNIIEFGLINKGNWKYNSNPINMWYQWDDKGNIKLVLREYYNYNYGYKIEIPSNWDDKFLVIEEYDENTNNKITFYPLYSNKYYGEMIFSIETYNKDKWNPDLLKKQKYIVLKESEKNIVIGILNATNKESKYFVNEKIIKTIFKNIIE
ncbi:hypothetical protein [Tepidibacter hydrothermalis]|uniref:FG-GAP repeat protein n=1 Tax=Tepidibacter hydrothermalis TaxID=3036126 RepID=A0ABY8ECR5_9FIRM|nr:hypothetical protein [Tepidibacter hydrothermalis]WFD10719.1 hypothetical protein P4S50_01200 [Tepidibacter hydrothermalis]